MKASLLRVLQPYMRDFARRVDAIPGNARLTSWLRTPAHNERVGGHPLSQHLIGLAADFVPQGATTRTAILDGARAQGLVAIDEGDHIHLQRYPAGAIAPFIDAARRQGLL